MTKTNRKYRDSLFVDLFARDQTAPANLLSLYNAIHGTNLSLETTTVEPQFLEQVLYLGYYNDVAAIIGGKILVLIEHQSTLNENMPLRCLLYVARFYEQFTTEDDQFRRKLITLTAPEFYVIYNGDDEAPPVQTLRLSNAFLSTADSILPQVKPPPLELTVNIYNTNKYKQLPFKSSCKALEDYTTFVDLINKVRKAGYKDYIAVAIKQAKQTGLMVDYLDRKSKEVSNMIFGEYNYERDIKVQREEAYEDGLEQGAHRKALETARKLVARGDSPEDVAQLIGLSLLEVRELVDSVAPTNQ